MLTTKMVRSGFSGTLPNIPLILEDNVTFPFFVELSHITSCAVSFKTMLQLRVTALPKVPYIDDMQNAIQCNPVKLDYKQKQVKQGLVMPLLLSEVVNCFVILPEEILVMCLSEIDIYFCLLFFRIVFHDFEVELLLFTTYLITLKVYNN